jgi:hypothetical protein
MDTYSQNVCNKIERLILWNECCMFEEKILINTGYPIHISGMGINQLICINIAYENRYFVTMLKFTEPDQWTHKPFVVGSTPILGTRTPISGGFFT